MKVFVYKHTGDLLLGRRLLIESELEALDSFSGFTVSLTSDANHVGWYLTNGDTSVFWNISAIDEFLEEIGDL